MVPLVEAIITAGVFQWGSVTMKCHPLGHPVRHLKCAALWRWISLCEYIIFQWGNPQELFFVWNNWKEYVLGDGRGSGASTLQAFMNLGTLRLPRTNTAHCFTLLTVKPNFMCWTSMYLEQNWNYPFIALLALSCISTLYFYAKSLSCILNTPLNPARLTAVTKFTPAPI